MYNKMVASQNIIYSLHTFKYRSILPRVGSIGAVVRRLIYLTGSKFNYATSAQRFRGLPIWVV